MRAVLFITTITTLVGLVPARSSYADEDGSTAWAALEKAEQFELFSLDPKEDNEKDGFHWYKILGRTTIKDADVRKKLVQTFGKGIDDFNGLPAKCFDPRHGIRVRKGDKTYDFLICFHCHLIPIFLGDKQIDTWYTRGDPQALFDKVLKDAKVPLPKSADE
jgi:hypothetical protein